MQAKKIIQEDFNNMHDFLVDYDYRSHLKDEDLILSLKQVHKSAYIFYLWKLRLEDKEINNILLDEILSTLIEILYASFYRDSKILYMLFRNIIDNFLKFIRLKLIVPDNLYTLQVFEEILKDESVLNSEILDISFKRLLNIYKYCCGYVHSTDNKFLTLNNSIRFYLHKEQKGKKFSKCIFDLIDMIKMINNIFIITYQDIYNGMNTHEKQLVNHFCNKQDLKLLFKELFDVVY